MVIKIDDKTFFYQETARTIVESILELFNRGIKRFESYEQWDYHVPISDPEEAYCYFNWDFEVVRADTDKPDFKYSFFVSAGRDCHDEPSITVSIVIPKGRHQTKIVLDYAELFDVVVHEIHHLAQNIDNNHYERNNDHQGKLAYLLDPYEIEAFHIGIRAHAALSNRTFDEIAEKYIRETWTEGSQDQINLIINTWKSTTFPVFKQNQY